MKQSNTQCPMCKKLYYRYPSQIKKGRDITCSRYCAARYFRDKGSLKNCLVCDKEFYCRQSIAKKGYGNYCSHKCWSMTRKTPFGKSTRSWTRQQILEWKDTKCARCGSIENLELDHILARSLGGKETRENCQTLCKRCNNRKYQLEDLPTYLKSKN